MFDATFTAMPLLLWSCLVSSHASPDDWTVSAPFQVSSDNNAAVSTLAFINVTRRIDGILEWERRELARFGSGYVGAAKGFLVHVTSNDPQDHTGCELPWSSSRTDGELPQGGTPWIALIKRGGCSFETKVENAFKKQAAGVIVYNDRDSTNLDKMKLSSDNGSKLNT